MRRLSLAGALVGLLLAACDDPPSPAPAPAAASDALRAAWRESITRRSAWQALVDNVPSLEKDDQRLDRLFELHRVWVRLPLATDPVVDAGQSAAILRHHAERLGLGFLDGIEVVPVPPRDPAPPAEVLASQGITYTDDQVMGTHTFTFRLPSRAAAERVVRGLAELERLPILDRLEALPDGAVVLHGRYRFLRDLKPTRIEPDHYDVAAILAAAGGDPGGEVAQKLRENYKKIEAMAAPMRTACHLEARLKLKSARYSAFTRFAEEQDRKRTWESLVGLAPPNDHHHAPASAPPSAPVTEPP